VPVYSMIACAQSESIAAFLIWLELSSHLHVLVALVLGKSLLPHLLVECEALGPQSQFGCFGVETVVRP
jgi:hypothetical protein